MSPRGTAGAMGTAAGATTGARLPDAGPAVLGRGWRDAAWDRLGEPWDVVVIGGGITGAGILRHATAMGLRALLVEQRDIAWGTSSRSSKLVHGGLRYLAQADVPLVRAAVLERERLLAAAPGLVDELGFVMPAYRGEGPSPSMLGAALTAYDSLGGRRGSRGHRRYRRDDLLLLAPHLAPEGLTGGFRYVDAWTDDARLTLRVALEAVRGGRHDPHVRDGRRAPPCRRRGRRRPRPRHRVGRDGGGPRLGRHQRDRRLGRPPPGGRGRRAADPAAAREPPRHPVVPAPRAAGDELLAPGRRATRSSSSRGRG